MTCSCSGGSSGLFSATTAEIAALGGSARGALSATARKQFADSDIRLYAGGAETRLFFGASDGNRHCFFRKVGNIEANVCFSITPKPTHWEVEVEATLSIGGKQVAKYTFKFDLHLANGDGAVTGFTTTHEDGPISALDFWSCIRRKAPHCIPVCIAGGGPGNPLCWACVAEAAFKCLL